MVDAEGVSRLGSASEVEDGVAVPYGEVAVPYTELVVTYKDVAVP